MNFEGSLPAMEAEGALILWSRSLERHNLRYKLMVVKLKKGKCMDQTVKQKKWIALV